MQTVQTLIRRRILRRLIWVCTVCECPNAKPSPGFRKEFGSETTGYGFHIANIWLVRLMVGLISLVNDNHVNNNLKEILVYIYSGSIVNNPPKNRKMSGTQCRSWLSLSAYKINGYCSICRRTKNVQIRLYGCTHPSGHSLFTSGIRAFFHVVHHTFSNQNI